MSHNYHSYHLVDPSAWPFTGSVAALTLTSGGVLYFQGNVLAEWALLSGLVLVLLTMVVWWRDVIREGTYLGLHTKIVQQGLRYGVILFIVSEIMFFFSFFWAFFHSSLAPAIEIGAIFPPTGIETLNAWEVPLLNTAILLSSGATVTWCHHAIVAGNRREAIVSLTITVLLGIVFTLLQGFEYYEAPFTIADSVYGSTFYLATGFHGLHVIIGTLFLAVCLARLIANQFTRDHHFGFEGAAWYWHFVDVVWLFLFVSIYYWGGN